VVLCVVIAGCESHAAASPAPSVRTPTTRTSQTGPAPRAVRGKVHVVRMALDNEGYRFDPAYLSVIAGDGVRFIMISGVPHNVAFDDQFIPVGARAQLVANLSLIGARDLAAPVVTVTDSSFVISTSDLRRGDYLFYCAPHRSLNMHGVITVR
jgi:plastocyanin